jgi:hypothetical protein
MTRTTEYFDNADLATCQACGGEHALRGGKVVRHHVAAHWRVKSGWCPGAGHPPLEVASALTDSLLAQTRTELDGLHHLLAQRDPASGAPTDVDSRWRVQRLSLYCHWLSAQLELVEAPIVPGRTLHYRAFVGTIERDRDGWCGRARDTNADHEIRYRAATPDRLVRAFRRAIDHYLITSERWRPEQVLSR